MKAKELMIGDFVRTAKDVCFYKGTIVQVRSIDGDNRFREKNLIGCATCIPIDDPDKMSWGVWVEYLEPIPLTPEILEKNFLKRHGAYVILDDYFEVEICEYNDGLYRLLYNCTEMSLPRTQITEIGFVHQLQHALRMVGVEQEITL